MVSLFSFSAWPIHKMKLLVNSVLMEHWDTRNEHSDGILLLVK